MSIAGEIAFTASRVVFHPNREVLLAMRFALMLPLIAIIVVSDNNRRYRMLMLVSFLFVLFADIILPFGFIFGMLAFMLVHLVNALNFVLLYRRFGEKEIFAGLIIVPLLLLGYYFFIYIMMPSSFTKPITLVYAIVISFSVYRAFCLLYSLELVKIGAFAAFLGAMLFYICDIQVGYNILVEQYSWFYISNAVIYYGALFLLAVSTNYV
jgi:hypothetical protein